MPPWHADRRSAQGVRSTTEGEKGRSARAELAPDRAIQVFPCHGVSSANVASQFYSIDFYVTHRFFGTFLVRPALLPYGKRGFLAAIYKIARPQPPAAALWLQESTVPLNFSAASAAAQRRRPGSSRWGWRPKCRPRPRRLRADRPAPRACPGRSPSAPPTCPAAE